MKQKCCRKRSSLQKCVKTPYLPRDDQKSYRRHLMLQMLRGETYRHSYRAMLRLHKGVVHREGLLVQQQHRHRLHIISSGLNRWLSWRWWNRVSSNRWRYNSKKLLKRLWNKLSCSSLNPCNALKTYRICKKSSQTFQVNPRPNSQTLWTHMPHSRTLMPSILHLLNQ